MLFPDETQAPLTAPNQPLADALLQFYGAARGRVLDSAVRFETPALDEVRSDFADLRRAFA